MVYQGEKDTTGTFEDLIRLGSDGALSVVDGGHGARGDGDVGGADGGGGAGGDEGETRSEENWRDATGFESGETGGKHR